MGAVRFIIALAIVGIFVVFGVKNMHPVTVHLYPQLGLTSKQSPLFFHLLGAFVLGASTAWLFGILEKVRLKRRLRREQSRLRKLERQVQEMEEKSLVPVLTEGENVKESHPAEVGPAEIG